MVGCTEVRNSARQARVKVLAARLDEFSVDGTFDPEAVASWVDGLLEVQKAEFLLSLDRVLREELDG